jgi:hypothetical protein
VPEGEINLKLIEGSTFVTSMTVTNNNMLLLCDFSNPRVLVYDVNNTILRYQIDTTYYPWDIAMENTLFPSGFRQTKESGLL